MSPRAIRASFDARRRQLGHARVVDGEAMPAVGDVLRFTQQFAGRVELVAGRLVWWTLTPFEDVPVGAERWEFLEALSRRGGERLRRRRTAITSEVSE